jgi:hypothetical protein
LIERGRLAYQALECREEAARYRAAAAELMEAIALAQSGDDGKLKVFLESMDHQAWSSGSPIPAPSTAPSAAPTPAPAVAQSTPSDFVPLVQVAKVELSQDNDTSDSWNEMIQGAQQRAEKENSARKSTAPKPTSKPAPKPAPKPMTKPAVDKLSSAMKKPSTIKSKKLNPTRFGLDVWISLGVHGVLLVILGLWVVVTIQNTPVLSVVAATVESNEVLMETPAESISQLDSTSTDSTSITTPDTSELKIEVDPSAISVEKTDLGIMAPSEASSISQQISKAGAPGNKMVEGAEFFGSKAVGNRFVYIVDASPSMRRDRAFDAAKEEILRSLRSMKPKQRFAILFFGGTLEALELDPGERIDQPQSATPENIEKAIRWLAKITIQKDGKPPIDAVKSALDFHPDGIFLLFDGDTKLDNWTQIVRRLNTSDGLLSDGGTKVPIHVIHFFRDEFQGSMRRLAEENAGTYRFVPKSNLRMQP